MKLELILDEGKADRAYFLAFGTGVVTEEVELMRDVTKCIDYVIKLKVSHAHLQKLLLRVYIAVRKYVICKEYTSQCFQKGRLNIMRL